MVVTRRVLRARLRSGSYLFDELPDDALPDTTFTDSLTLRLNGEQIRILAFPGAHDDNDAIVWFTGSKLVAAGDLAYSNGFPSVEEVTGHVLGHREVLPKIMTAIVEREWKGGGSVPAMQQAGILKDWEGFSRGYVSIDEWIASLADPLQPAAAARTLYEPTYHKAAPASYRRALEPSLANPRILETVKQLGAE